jgi:VanZ family protein
MVTAGRPHSRLPHFLAALYGLAIVYASLQPFASWLAPSPGTPFFLFAPWPSRWVRYDVITNLVAYVPFGFFAAQVPRRARSASLTVAVAAGALLSFSMETLQMFLPTRDASVADLLSNTSGAAIGGALAMAFARSPGAKRRVAAVREHWFLPGTVVDLGLALLTIWLVTQINPGIPLFATTYDPAAQSGAATAGSDLAATLVAAAHSAFQLLGVGLFLALLLRERRYVGGAALLLVGAAAVVKGIAAVVLLRPAAWEHWLTPAVSLGVAAGSLLLSMAIWLPRPAQVTLAAIALLSSLLATVFAPDLLFASAPLTLFNWSYGQLLNFNGLTHAVLLLWPAIASAFLFALAGRPGWGEAG